MHKRLMNLGISNISYIDGSPPLVTNIQGTVSLLHFLTAHRTLKQPSKTVHIHIVSETKWEDYGDMLFLKAFVEILTALVEELLELNYSKIVYANSSPVIIDVACAGGSKIVVYIVGVPRCKIVLKTGVVESRSRGQQSWLEGVAENLGVLIIITPLWPSLLKKLKATNMQGIVQRPKKISKYLKALPAMTAVSEKTLMMAYMKQDSLRTETSTSERDLQQEQRIKSTIREKMINPFFLSSDNLMNISTGETTQSVELIDARQRGLDALEKTEESKTKKVDPVKLKTFVEKTKKQPAQQQTKELYMEERAARKRKSMHFLMSGLNTQVPSSYLMCSIQPVLQCEKETSLVMEQCRRRQWHCSGKEPEELPASDMKTGYFIDLMAFIQRYQDLGSVTFQELSRKYLQKILSIIPQHCDIVHVVGDRYDLNQEPEDRGKIVETKKI
ncbi:hypothetical protein GQR58_011574 [Nymphon striatum]|nr:hypothetical protein GQR58_011574 [Nymphon striatum]